MQFRRDSCLFGGPGRSPGGPKRARRQRGAVGSPRSRWAHPRSRRRSDGLHTGPQVHGKQLKFICTVLILPTDKYVSNVIFVYLTISINSQMTSMHYESTLTL